MSDDRWTRVKDLLSLALSLPVSERAAALDRECGADAALRQELEELLASEREMGAFLEDPAGSGSDSAEDLPAALQTWTRYQIIGRIGSGGMAVVYKAWDPRLSRLIAIKLISGHDDLTVRRFLREAEAQARIDHEHVLKVYETGVIGPHYYIAMQYVDGPTLMGVRSETTLEHKAELILKVAEGLHAAHRHGLVHRDIKPGNILVERTPEGLKPLLLDFGLAVDVGAPSLTQTGVLVGTPLYMAPERIGHDTASLDRRSDVYSLGATFYEFIAGVTPFAGASGLRVLMDALEGDFTPLARLQPTVSRELDAIVSKCLETDPHARYPSARALAEDLRRYLDGDHVLARPAGTVARAVKRLRKHPRLAAGFLALALTTLAAAAWGGYGYWRWSRQAEVAQELGQEVRDLEWLFRAAQMSPLHPIAPERQAVRVRMERVSAMMAQAGSIAAGPGNYALGRGFLTLGDSARALPHLERAWASGYRTPDAATALGLAHAEIFRVELGRAERIAADTERAARTAALEAAHRDAALLFLAQGRANSIVPVPYVEALIAAQQNDRRTAIARAEEAARQTPWLFEARLLSGHLELKEAVRLYLRGEHQPAHAIAREADRQYLEAQRIADSAIDAYLGRCSVAGLVLHMAQHGLAAEAEAAHRQADESCSRALIIDPGSGEAYRLHSEAVRAWGNLAVLTGSNPHESYERAAGLATRALELSAGSLDAMLTLADTFMDRAWGESKSGADPTRSVDRAVAAFEKVLAVDPRNVAGLTNMGQALVLRSRFERTHGADARATQDRCVAIFQRALRLDPALAGGYRNLERAAIARADAEAQRGGDVAFGLDGALRFIEGLPGDRDLAARVDAVSRLRARQQAPSPGAISTK